MLSCYSSTQRPEADVGAFTLMVLATEIMCHDKNLTTDENKQTKPVVPKLVVWNPQAM